jgi:hypothetical protein
VERIVKYRLSLPRADPSIARIAFRNTGVLGSKSLFLSGCPLWRQIVVEIRFAIFRIKAQIVVIFSRDAFARGFSIELIRVLKRAGLLRSSQQDAAYVRKRLDEWEDLYETRSIVVPS